MDLQGILGVNISIICHNYALRVLLACSLLAVVGICCFKEVKEKRKRREGLKFGGKEGGAKFVHMGDNKTRWQSKFRFGLTCR